MVPAQRLSEFLINEWSAGLRLTTIPQAMQRLGMRDDLRLRWRAAGQLEALWRGALTSPEKRREIAKALGRPVDEAEVDRFRQQVTTWNLASVALSEGEKLVARHILLHRREGLPLPRPTETAKGLGLPAREVHRALRMLARVGFVSLRDRRRPASYALANGYEKLLEGLGFFFHTVSLDTGERFGVPWAHDFLLLVSSQYKEQRVSLDDACAHCVDRIHIEVDRGVLAQVEPPEAVVYRGGTWGQNNLFRSEEHLKEWNNGKLPEADRWKPLPQFMAESAMGR